MKLLKTAADQVDFRSGGTPSILSCEFYREWLSLAASLDAARPDAAGAERV